MGVIPIAYGDRDGYSTDNWVTYMYGSYMSPGDIARVNSGKLPYTDPEAREAAAAAHRAAHARAA